MSVKKNAKVEQINLILRTVIDVIARQKKNRV